MEEYTSDDIRSLSAGEHIRMRPNIYFSKVFDEGTLDFLPLEIMCHAFDEYFDGNCKNTTISLFSKSFYVSYDAGISLDLISDDCTKAEAIMNQMYACRNEKKHLSVGEEFCDLGIATINFASSKCEMTTISNGKKGTFIFENGETKSKKIENSAEQNQTTFFVIPDDLIFNNLKLTFSGVQNKINKALLKLPGFSIQLIDKIEN